MSERASLTVVPGTAVMRSAFHMNGEDERYSIALILSPARAFLFRKERVLSAMDWIPVEILFTAG